MRSVTDYILSKTNKISVSPEVSPGAAEQGWKMFNDAGCEVEISELLYSLVRVMKPKLIFETGCHHGISSSYMGLALKENNNGGVLHTCEIFGDFLRKAHSLWTDLEIQNLIVGHNQESLKINWPSDTKFDILFLDSEPQLRQNEMVKYFDMVIPGGLIIIHDLNERMGKTGQSYDDREPHTDWPWGPFEDTIGKYILSHQIQSIALPNPRGCMMFQKSSEGNNTTNLLLGKPLLI